MNILYINISDIKGGAALGSYRLHQEILKRGFSSNMLVGEAVSKSPLVNQLPKTNVDKVLRSFTNSIGLNYINMTSTFSSVTSHPFYKEADIVNLHCLHNGFFNYLALPKITRGKPTVYKLSDMWSFTGHCAYSLDCEKWQSGCGKCPYPKIYPAIKHDSTRLEWKLKKYVYESSDMTVVVPSRWLKETAKKSILGKYDINFIPNGIDLDQYIPLDKENARKAIGIPEGKKAILFVAQNLDDPRKGIDLLIDSLKKLPSSLKKDLVLVCLGSGGENIKGFVDLPLLDLGYITGDRLKALIYSAVDVFVFPTRADIFGLVLLESMACGTPVVSFDTTAVPELIRPGKTGLLAKPEDSSDLSSKIVEILEDEPRRQYMAKKCREVAVSEYSIELQAERYMNLYRKVIDTFHQQ